MDDLEQAIANLNSEDIDVRWHAANRFVSERSPQAVDKLIELLRDSDSAVRAKAAQALGPQYDRKAFEPVSELLHDSDPEVRAAAAGALWRISLGDERIAPLLLPLLDDAEPEVRAAAAESVGYGGDPSVLGQLLYRLHDAVAEVRASAARALGNLGQEAAFPALYQAIKEDEDYSVRYSAISALGGVGRTSRRTRTYVTVGDEDWNAVDVLLDIVTDFDEMDTGLRGQAIDALREIGDPRAVAPLLTTACNLDSDEREEAIFALGYLGDTRAVPYLIAILSDEKYQLHTYAAGALADLGDPRALPELDRLAESGDERPTHYGDNIAAAARKAAAEIREKLTWQDFDCLVNYLKSDDHGVRYKAIKTLAAFPDPRVPDLALSVLNHEDLLVFIYSAKIVANAGEARALPLLTQAAEYWQAKDVSGAVEVAEAAAAHIRRKLNGEDVGPYVDFLDDEDEDDEDADDGWVGGDSPEPDPDLDW